MTDVRIELPFPPAGLNPNRSRGLHWAAKGKIVRDYREAVAWAAVYGKQVGYGMFPRLPMAPPVRASVTFVVPDRRKRDLDNLLSSIKPLWDGLVDAGVLAGDDSERFSVESAEVVEGKLLAVGGGREAKVIVELRSL